MDKKRATKQKKKTSSKPPPVVHNEEEQDENEEEPLEVRFEREVAWCKAEIFKKLHHVKLDSKQGFDLARALKILDSDKNPMIKKRQAMRTTLGDYRKKMKEEERKQAAAAKKMTLKPAEDEQTKLSKCYKVAASQQKPSNEEECDKTVSSSLAGGDSQSNEERITALSLADGEKETLQKKSEDNESFKFVKTDQKFLFNFSSSDEPSVSIGDGDTKGTK